MTRLNFNKGTVISVIILGLVFAAEICSAGVVHIHSTNTITGETIFVKDIADIEAPDALTEKIGNIKIGASPQPGKKKNIPSGLIKSRIFSAVPDSGVRIVLPSATVRVERDYQVASQAALERIFRDYVQKNLKDAKIKIKGIKIQGNTKFSKGKLVFEVEKAKDKKISGHFKLIVNAKPEIGKMRRLMISGWVERYEEVVYARHEIAKGETIKENSLYTKITNITRYPLDIFNAISLVTGQAAKTKIRKNVLLRQKMVEASFDIKKGEIVKIKANSGLLTVVTTGRAIDDARIGEQVRVRNIKSNKIITGYVADSKTIEVVF